MSKKLNPRIDFLLFSLLTADQLLVHSWMFSTHSYCTAIPLSAREGMPLFYMSPNENIPVSSHTHLSFSMAF